MCPQGWCLSALKKIKALCDAHINNSHLLYDPHHLMILEMCPDV